MTSKNLIDPGLLKLFNNDPPAVDIKAENLAQMHQIFIGQSITGPAGNDLEVLIYHPEKPKGARQPGILHMHGGGYVADTAEMNKGFRATLDEPGTRNVGH